MSDTPRTDAQINGEPCTRFVVLAGDSLRNALVPSEFARQLERENAALRADKERLLTALKICRTALFIENEHSKSQFRDNGELPFDYAIEEADAAIDAARKETK